MMQKSLDNSTTIKTTKKRPKTSSNGAMPSTDLGQEVVKVPLKSDILCGKDKRAVCHEGSVRFREIIDKYRERYCSDSCSKQEKMRITKEIVARVCQSQRFLKYDSKRKVWHRISALAARDKISHALRFAHFKENHKTGKAKDCKRRSSSSDSSTAESQTPEDNKLWQELILRQAKLLDSIKKGKGVDGTVPSIFVSSTPTKPNKPSAVNTEAPEKEDLVPLCIHDNSFEENPLFRDYCFRLHSSGSSFDEEDNASHPFRLETLGQTKVNFVFEEEIRRTDHTCQIQESSDSDGSESDTNGSCFYDDNSSKFCDESSQPCGFDDDIASMIAEPLIAWDIDHDGIFEV